MQERSRIINKRAVCDPWIRAEWWNEECARRGDDDGSTAERRIRKPNHVYHHNTHTISHTGEGGRIDTRALATSGCDRVMTTQVKICSRRGDDLAEYASTRVTITAEGTSIHST